MQIIRYDKSHQAKLVLLSDKMKIYYERLKNHILSYDKVKNSISWEGERFYLGRQTLIKFLVRGKTINVYFALEPSEVDEKYGIVDCSDIKKYQATKVMLKMKGPRSLTKTIELVDELMGVEEIEYNEECEESYGLFVKTRSLETLLDEGLIKPVYGEGKAVTLTLDDPEDDEDEEEDEEDIVVPTPKTKVAKTSFVVKGYKKNQVARSLRTIINLATVEANFEDGDIVNLDTLKDKNLIEQDILYVKLLAEGSISKNLLIELNEFSVNSVKKLSV